MNLNHILIIFIKLSKCNSIINKLSSNWKNYSDTCYIHLTDKYYTFRNILQYISFNLLFRNKLINLSHMNIYTWKTYYLTKYN